MKAFKVVGIVLGSLIVLVLIVVGVVFVLLNTSSGIASQVTPVATNPQAAQQLDAKWDNFENTVNHAAPDTPVTLTLTQEEVNSKIAAELSKTDLPANLDVSNVNVNLTGGEILASAKINYSGISANIGVKAKVEVVDGNPVVVVQDLDLGKLPIPQAVKDQIMGLIPNDGKVDLSKLPLNVQDIQIIDGQIVLKGITK